MNSRVKTFTLSHFTLMVLYLIENTWTNREEEM